MFMFPSSWYSVITEGPSWSSMRDGELPDRKDPGTLVSKLLMWTSDALDLKVLGFVAFMAVKDKELQ